MDIVNAYLIKHTTLDRWGQRRPCRLIVCKDGFYMSVQAGEYLYSAPRIDFYEGGYTAVEVGFPSERVEALMPYAEEPDDPMNTVYGWVPIEIVVEIVNAHGGIIEED